MKGLARFLPLRGKRLPIVLPLPESSICVIGDIHGEIELLSSLWAQISQLSGAQSRTTILVGDYIDRGEHSASVLEMVFRKVASGPENTIALMGNHERMLLDFLDDPSRKGKRWLRHGGLQTLASFGIGGFGAGAAAHHLEEAAFKLRHGLKKIDAGFEEWLRSLPLYWTSGNVVVCHAGLDPSAPLAAQSERTLLWGHANYAQPRTDGLVVVHGHIVSSEVEISSGRIGVDVGAYRTGKLACVEIQPDGTTRTITV